MIDFKNIENLKKNRFSGFKTVKELWISREDIPKKIYQSWIAPEKNIPTPEKIYQNPTAAKTARKRYTTKNIPI